MVAVGHTAVGVIVGVTSYQLLGQGNIIEGLIITGAAGVISHYIADFIPHGHYVKAEQVKHYLSPIIIFDVLLPILFILTAYYLKSGLTDKLLFIMFGIGGAQLPDVLDGLIYTGKLKYKGLLKLENDFHQGLHWHGQGPKALLLGLRDLWQILIIITAMILVIF